MLSIMIEKMGNPRFVSELNSPIAKNTNSHMPSLDMKNDIIKKMAIGKVSIQLYIILIGKDLKISVEHGRVVKTLNITKL